MKKGIFALSCCLIAVTMVACSSQTFSNTQSSDSSGSSSGSSAASNASADQAKTIPESGLDSLKKFIEDKGIISSNFVKKSADSEMMLKTNAKNGYTLFSAYKDSTGNIVQIEVDIYEFDPNNLSELSKLFLSQVKENMDTTADSEYILSDDSKYMISIYDPSYSSSSNKDEFNQKRDLLINAFKEYK